MNSDEAIERDIDAWSDDDMLNVLTSDNGDDVYDDYYETARDCIGGRMI